MTIEINNQAGGKVDLNLMKRVVSFFVGYYKINPAKPPLRRGTEKSGEISIALVSDAEMKRLNRTYRAVNRPTDVLSFPGEGDFFGEIILDFSQIKRQAKILGKAAGEELIFILVHGLLHLAGYDDRTEAGRLRMIKLGEDLIKKFKAKSYKVKKPKPSIQ